VLESTRQAIRTALTRSQTAIFLFLSALLPYLVFTIQAETFHRNALILLVGLVGVFAFWHLVLPRRLAYDFGFLVIAALPILLRVFKRIYLSPDPHIRLDVLGQLMWIRVGLVGLLLLREWNPGPVGLWPTSKEWRSGIAWFVAMIVPLVGIALAIHDVTWAPVAAPWWKIAAVAVGTFFGILWVVALSEELFFRGVLQRALLNSSAGPVVAIAVSTVLFASAHLWFHQFPDWKQSTVAAVLGIGCGLAYWQTGSIRASMVTHAFTVVTWRVLFTK
jgi:uncharacterized protein